LAFAEVSDKEPTLGLIWAVGAFSAFLCFVVARLQRWLAPVVGALPLLWFVSLLMEIHASDVAPAPDGFRAKTTRNAGVPITLIGITTTTVLWLVLRPCKCSRVRKLPLVANR
jgi:hypothetical protein